MNIVNKVKYKNSRTPAVGGAECVPGVFTCAA